MFHVEHRADRDILPDAHDVTKSLRGHREHRETATPLCDLSVIVPRRRVPQLRVCFGDLA